LMKGKPFSIPKSLVWQAYEMVRKNKGACGYDGQSIEEFETDRDKNLYKIWNRMSSGTYFPPPVLLHEIPKNDGGTRILGIPTVGDRIAQATVKILLERPLERVFDEDSYGYRPGRSPVHALEAARQRIWKYAWVIDIDIKGFFDNIRHDLVLKALRRHCKEHWVLLYVERWLRAPLIDREGKMQERQKGTPQGGVISPLLANLYLHYGLDCWMRRNFPKIEFERFADDAILHCKSEAEADHVLQCLKGRMEEIGLELHPEKTKKVFCGGPAERNKGRLCEFKFLGFDFKTRTLKDPRGRLFRKMAPGPSVKAMKGITAFIKGWNLHRATALCLEDISIRYSPVVRGWINYFARYCYRNFAYRLWSVLQSRLLKWYMCKFKVTQTIAEKKLGRIRRFRPTMFPHWYLLSGGSRAV